VTAELFSFRRNPFVVIARLDRAIQ